MKQKHQHVDVKNLCSRKLWDILVSKNEYPLSPSQEFNIEAELLERCHYLSELNLWRNKSH